MIDFLTEAHWAYRALFVIGTIVLLTALLYRAAWRSPKVGGQSTRQGEVWSVRAYHAKIGSLGPMGTMVRYGRAWEVEIRLKDGTILVQKGMDNPPFAMGDKVVCTYVAGRLLHGPTLVNVESLTRAAA